MFAARAPLATTQVPGFYRFPLGQFQVTVVSDGRFTLSYSPDVSFARQRTSADSVIGSDFQALDNVLMQTRHSRGQHRGPSGAD